MRAFEEDELAQELWSVLMQLRTARRKAERLLEVSTTQGRERSPLVIPPAPRS